MDTNVSYLFLADGFEEVEALATTDVLRRAEMQVRTVAVKDDFEVTGAHGITVKADLLIADVAVGEDTEWLICPGGMPGATNLASNDKLKRMLVDQNKRGGKIAAICASPAVVLSPLGLLKGRRATCYPGFEPIVDTEAEMTGQPVVVDGNLITGNGPASTLSFALAIVTATKGAEAAGAVAQGMLYKA
ncbi:MAG: DJ-1/PfpI family protein [Bacteroides sp.]|nr:DJ-1/PfpI family protein [Bacteroides sp.]MCM1413222.1 DJ-1/PfpI family protein [Bacteroides sp.]MCM1471468.1 DJ-1/PfpI family protein [Bacteroides sp.]